MNEEIFSQADTILLFNITFPHNNYIYIYIYRYRYRFFIFFKYVLLLL